MSIGFVTIALWILMATVGVIVTAFNLWDAILDYRYLHRRELANGRFLVAEVSVVTEAARLVAHILLLVAGCLVASVQFNPDPPPASLYVRSTILLTIAMLVGNSIAMRWLRNKLRPGSKRAAGSA